MRRLAGLAVSALLVASAAGASRAEDGVSATEILLGGTNALSGAVAASCGPVTRGSEAYFDRVNRAGGVNGRTIRYVVLDDGYSAQRAIANARRLTQQDKVFAMFGGCGTVGVTALVPLLEASGVPFAFPYAGVERLVTPIKPNLFGLMPQYEDQLSRIVPYAVERFKPRTAAVFIMNTAGADRMREAVRSALARANVKIEAMDAIDLASPDRAPFVLAAKDKNVDLLVVMDSGTGSSRFVIEMERQGWSPKAMTGSVTMTDEGFLRAAEKTMAGKVVMPAVVVPPTDPAAKECVDALATFDKGTPANHFTMFGCLAAKVFTEGLRRAGTDLTRAKLTAALESLDRYDTGLTAPITISPTNHAAISSMIPLGIEGDRFKILGDPL